MSGGDWERQPLKRIYIQQEKNSRQCNRHGLAEKRKSKEQETCKIIYLFGLLLPGDIVNIHDTAQKHKKGTRCVFTQSVPFFS